MPPGRRPSNPISPQTERKTGEGRLSPPPPPLTIPPPLEGPSVKKSTSVDVINSKISYGTVIPVEILQDAAAFTAKCRPYDIIEGKNPLSDDEEDTSRPHRATLAAVKAEVEAASDSRTPPTNATNAGRRRKRSESPALVAARKGRGGTVKKEGDSFEEVESNGSNRQTGGRAVIANAASGDVDAEHFVSHVTPSPLLANPHVMPTIEGWARYRLHDSTPFQIQTAKDVETRVKYMLDDADYEWCAQQDVSPEVLQKSFTFFEWAYTSFLLNAAKGGSDEAPSTFSPVALADNGGSHGGSGGSSRNGQHRQGSASGSNGASALNPSIRSFLTQAKKLNSTICTVCAKPVHIVTSTDKARLSELQATESVGLQCAECGVIAHLQCWCLPVLPRHPEQWVCDGCYLCNQHRRRAAFTRCVICGRGGGVFFPYRAKDPTSHGQPQHSCLVTAKNAASAFPSAPPKLTKLTKRGDALAEGESEKDVLSPSSPSTLQASESGLCHAVCALAFPELSIRLPDTFSLPQSAAAYESIDSSRCANAMVDTGLRPCVVPARRIPKQIYNCIYCQHGTCPTVQCQHPRCYEAMHPSCAAEQHTLECFAVGQANTRTAGGRNASGNGTEGGESSEKIVTVNRTTGPEVGEPVAPRNGANEGSHHATPLGAAALLTPWTGCSVYCRKHFGYNITRTFGSAVLSEKAEAQSLEMNLHSLLSGLPMTYAEWRGACIVKTKNEPDGDEEKLSGPSTRLLPTNEAFFLQGSLPVAKAVRRGPGRPSAAELRQREAEKTVVAKVRRYWQQKRSEHRRQSAALASDINISQSKPILAAALRPELIKISVSKVRLSHFLCLIPEWQQVLVAHVEGELPLPDDEYDDVQRYRKASAHTRRSGNTSGLFQRMILAQQNLTTLRACCDLVKQQGAVRAKVVEAELQWCDLLTGWHPSS